MQLQTIVHTIPPLYDSESRVLLLGTFPSPKSRASGFFYGHPQNRFWPALCAALGETDPKSAQGRGEIALRRGVALWDVLASCEIVGASDASIREARPNDLAPILTGAPIAAVFTTGKKAAQLYRRLIEPDTGRPATTLPSPSPANCAVRFEALVEAYRQILPFLS